MELRAQRHFSVTIPVISGILILIICPRWTHGHGRLIDPPARNSMWRFGFDNPVNYNDNELYCGGRMVQWLKNGGKCGVCGDSYHGDRPHEAGGKYANGIIAKTYEEGSEMEITVHLTANHLGFFEFRLCPNNDPKTRIQQSCLDKYLLERPDGQGTRFYVPKGKYNAMFNYTLKLPRGLTCEQCVIQWKYRTGNTWDKEIDSGRFCLGCGPQEEFYNCADIAIEPRRQPVIEYPTSQPQPPKFIPPMNLPTVATVKTTRRDPESIFTKSPHNPDQRDRYPGRRPMPPRLPHIPPPPRLPHSKTHPVNKDKQPSGEQMTSIFTTAKPKTKRPTKPRPTRTTTKITTTQSTTTTQKTIPTTVRRTTRRPKPTLERKNTMVIPRQTWARKTRKRTKSTAATTVDTTTTTTRKLTTTTEIPKSTRSTTTSTTSTVTTTASTQKPSRKTTVAESVKVTTPFYKIIPRITWRPTVSDQKKKTKSPDWKRTRSSTQATVAKTTPRDAPKNPFERFKTKPTSRSPFKKPTTVRYRYWKPKRTKYPLLKDNLELEDIKEDDISEKQTSTKSPTSTKQRETKATKPTQKTSPVVMTTRSTTAYSTDTTTLSSTTTEPKTSTTQKSTRTTRSTTQKIMTPKTAKTTMPTTRRASSRPTRRRTRPRSRVWTVPTYLPELSTKLVKWWTNKPETTTPEVTTTTRKASTSTRRFTKSLWSTPSLWWPPIWLPWTPWTQKTKKPTTTTTMSTTTESPATTTMGYFRPSRNPWTDKERKQLDRISDTENMFEKVDSGESLPWYVGGDISWKSSRTTNYEKITETPEVSSTTTQKTTTIPLCLHSSTPKPEHRQNLVKSPFEPPPHLQWRWTRPPPFGRKTPPVWRRTAIPPVIQPVQPPPPSHHLWVKKNVKTCRAIIPLAVGMNDWCFVNCNSGFCPTKFCYCEYKHRRPRYRYRTKKPPLWWKESLNSRPRPTPTIRPKFLGRKRVETSRPKNKLSDREQALQKIKQNMYRCRGIGQYSNRPEFDDWCQTNCRSVLCPLLICGCTWR